MAVAQVSQYGAIKYDSPLGDRGFLQVENAKDRYTDALLRHIVDEDLQGAVNDGDGGVLHAAQAAWDALARLEALLALSETGFPAPHYRTNPPPMLKVPFGERRPGPVSEGRYWEQAKERAAQAEDANPHPYGSREKLD